MVTQASVYQKDLEVIVDSRHNFHHCASVQCLAVIKRSLRLDAHTFCYSIKNSANFGVWKCCMSNVQA